MSVQLRALRRARGIPPQDVAEALGYSIRTVYHHERPDIRLRPNHVKAYARFYGVPPENLEEAAA
jgi:DNA-binding CsgD family transcriptional regulator